jgi:hypothetical protein
MPQSPSFVEGHRRADRVAAQPRDEDVKGVRVRAAEAGRRARGKHREILAPVAIPVVIVNGGCGPPGDHARLGGPEAGERQRTAGGWSPRSDGTR